MYTIITEKEVTQILREEKKVSLAQYVGMKVKFYRDKLGINQVQLSIRAGGLFSNSAISRLERGEDNIPNLKTLIDIANALGVHFQDLLPQKEEKPVTTENNQTV